MNPQKARWIWVVVAAQALALLGWAGYHEVIRQTAPTLRLKTAPIDPRDVLRGDYITLNYDIGRPDKSTGRPDTLSGEVYVVFKPGRHYHVIEEILAEPPAKDDGRVWVVANAWGAPDNPRLEYGIERFFVPEGRGRLEFTTIDVEASVSATNRLYVRRVWLDGERFP